MSGLAPALDENPRVLLVEDNDEFRGVIARQFDSMGYRVHETANAGSFLGELASAKQPFDLVVVDIRLPGLGGNQVVSWLLDSEETDIRSMPILIVTGYANELPSDIIARHPTVSLLPKPYRMDDLEREVSRLRALAKAD